MGNIYDLLGLTDPNKSPKPVPTRSKGLTDPLSQSIEALIFAEKTGDWNAIALRYKEAREKGKSLI